MAQQAVSIRDSSILKPKKLTLAQQDWSLPAVEWSPNRKKPVRNSYDLLFYLC